MLSFSSSMSTGGSCTASYTGPGWGPSEGEGCGCPLLFPLHLNPQMNAASRAPRVKDSRKMVMETPTTAPAPRPMVVDTGTSVGTEEDGFQISFLTVPVASVTSMYYIMGIIMSMVVELENGCEWKTYHHTHAFNTELCF